MSAPETPQAGGTVELRWGEVPPWMEQAGWEYPPSEHSHHALAMMRDDDPPNPVLGATPVYRVMHVDAGKPCSDGSNGEAGHTPTYELTPHDLPEPMKRVICSCGEKFVGMSTRQCEDKFEAHRREQLGRDGQTHTEQTPDTGSRDERPAAEELQRYYEGEPTPRSGSGVEPGSRTQSGRRVES